MKKILILKFLSLILINNSCIHKINMLSSLEERNLYKKGIIFLESNEPDKAVLAFKQLLKNTEKAEYKSGLALSYITLGKIDKSYNILKENIFNNNPCPSYYYLGLVSELKGEFHSALKYYEICKEYLKNDPGFINNYNIFLYEQGFSSKQFMIEQLKQGRILSDSEIIKKNIEK